ncbi:hypothetical protein [Microcystis aeruginosa]|uniref:hypothetical protein n=1 Tax=Microcystis aeruginosa TaxID=1126 RepID=UPI0023309CE9|nr:hypothetical protein [Microcystis aeruginosa]MDB9416665.1 hypothetical protein [Microcystis aeruginosa CS-556/03]
MNLHYSSWLAAQLLLKHQRSYSQRQMTNFSDQCKRIYAQRQVKFCQKNDRTLGGGKA